MHASKDSMWRRMWKILQNFLGSKQGQSEKGRKGKEAGAVESQVYWPTRTTSLFGCGKRRGNHPSPSIRSTDTSSSTDVQCSAASVTLPTRGGRVVVRGARSGRVGCVSRHRRRSVRSGRDGSVHRACDATATDEPAGRWGDGWMDAYRSAAAAAGAGDADGLTATVVATACDGLSWRSGVEASGAWAGENPSWERRSSSGRRAVPGATPPERLKREPIRRACPDGPRTRDGRGRRRVVTWRGDRVVGVAWARPARARPGGGRRWAEPSRRLGLVPSAAIRVTRAQHCACAHPCPCSASYSLRQRWSPSTNDTVLPVSSAWHDVPTGLKRWGFGERECRIH